MTFSSKCDIIHLLEYKIVAGESRNLNQNQQQPKGASYLLFFLAIAALGVGFWQIGQDIRLPFSLDKGFLPDTNLASTINADDLALLGRDTDNDSLLDYDEVNIYNTSPYLADTDSDGYTDAEEIQSNHNPNCPSNETCLVAPVIAEGTLAPQNVNELRQLLLKSGVSQEELAKIDDQTILQLYQELNVDAATTAPTNTETTTNDTATTSTLTQDQKDAVAKMSASELRTFLIESGAPVETVNQLDDATIKSLVNQALGI